MVHQNVDIHKNENIFILILFNNEDRTLIHRLIMSD